MDIQLKHIKLFRQLTKETICFSAKIHVDGKWFANCANAGEGGATTYELRDHFDKKAKEKLAEIEDYFRQMPDYWMDVPEQFHVAGNRIKVKMDFAEWIDLQISEEWDKKERARLFDLDIKKQQRLLRKQRQ